MDTHEVVSCVRGYHIYGNIWIPSVGDLLSCERESGNLNDLYAVAIKNGASMDCSTLVTFLLAALLCVYVRMRGGSYSEFEKAIIRKSLSLRPLFWLRVSVLS